MTLGYSRHQYVHVTFSQKIPDLIEGLEDAWTFFGGCVGRVVVDNLKPAVTKADRYDPIFARTFEDYARYRGFVIDPAPPYMPTGKPIVERAVPYVHENFGSSAESVGDFGLGKVAKGMIEGDLEGSEGPKAVCFSGSEFQLVVEALHSACGNGAASTGPVEEELSVTA